MERYRVKKYLYITLAISMITGVFISASAGATRAQENSAAKKWTIMVYSNADNNLDGDLVNDVLEMERAGLSNDVNIVVEIDRLNKPARRYCVTARDANSKPDDWGFSGKMVKDMGEIDMGDPKELVTFAKWACDNYPAAKYMLLIQNHGSGWKKRKADAFRGISYDDQSGHNISTKQLGSAIQTISSLMGKPIDIFATDACLMQMLEVDYEIKDFVRYIVSSEEMVPGPCWSYESIFAPIMNDPKINARELASMIPQAYAESYKTSVKNSTTMSAVDCAFIEELSNAVDSFAKAYLEINGDSNELAVVKAAVSKTQKFYDCTCIDIGHFMKLMVENSKNRKLIECAGKVLMAYQKAVFKSEITGVSTKNASGMAIYFPTDHYNRYYDMIKFSKSNWDEFIKSIYKMGESYGDEPYDPTASDADGVNSGFSFGRRQK